MDRLATLSDVHLRRLLRARDRIHAAYAEPLPLDALAREARLSRFHFVRLFKRAFGDSPHAYLTQVRLEEAKRLLAGGAAATEACAAVGYASLGSFSARFARSEGLSPRAWQRRVRTVVSVPERVGAVWIPGCFLALYAPSKNEEAATPRLR